MINAQQHALSLLAKLFLAIALLLMLVGVLWHGITIENVERFWRNVRDRPTGLLSFRFILQPSMAALIAIGDGLHDARRRRSPFFWTILWKARERGRRLREGINATARILLLGLVMDTVYQLLTLDTFHPYEALIVALLLAFLPYLVIRGPVTRIAGKWLGDARLRRLHDDRDEPPPTR